MIFLLLLCACRLEYVGYYHAQSDEPATSGRRDKDGIWTNAAVGTFGPDSSKCFGYLER